ncbi:hypothetical protein QM012_000207 [Aureobasidium pullulans]|uniref:Uncharacterized protein n=1 Tax=Aureobasidium pullulans TaxID=5580 RepID=A0ABR0TVR1_AURPU
MMSDQHHTSTTQSLQDSLLSDCKAYHSNPIHPPRSQASHSQKATPKPKTLTSEGLATLKPMDKDQAALHTHSRILTFLHQLPDIPVDPTDDIPTPIFELPETKPQVHYYIPPFHPHHMHIYKRFQEMRCTEPHAEFHRHKAWVTLQYSVDGKVGMYVGVEDEEHAYRIHQPMRWLRDKWLGYEVNLVYYIVEYEDDGEQVELEKYGKMLLQEGRKLAEEYM